MSSSAGAEGPEPPPAGAAAKSPVSAGMSERGVEPPPLPPPAASRGVAAGVGGVAGAGGKAAAVAAAGVVARAGEELDRVGDDVDRLALLALRALPLTPLQAPVDGDRAALGQVAGAVLALRAPHGDVEVVGLVDPLVGRVVLAARVARHPELAQRGAARQRAQLGIGGQVAGDDHPVDV